MDINTLLPPMIGSFFGAIIAFALNYGYQYIKAKKDKKKYITILKSEIDSCINTLGRDRVQLLPTEKWISLANSGALKFFDVNIELEPLSVNYQVIQCYNTMINTLDLIGRDWDFIDDEIKEEAIRLDNKLKKLRDSELFK